MTGFTYPDWLLSRWALACFFMCTCVCMCVCVSVSLIVMTTLGYLVLGLETDINVLYVLCKAGSITILDIHKITIIMYPVYFVEKQKKYIIIFSFYYILLFLSACIHVFKAILYSVMREHYMCNVLFWNKRILKCCTDSFFRLSIWCNWAPAKNRWKAPYVSA